MRVGDEFVGQLGDRLQPARHQRAGRAAADQQRPDADHGDHHEQRGIGEGDLVPADVAERRELLDFELMNRIGHRRICPVVPKLPRLSRPLARPAGNTGGAHHVEDAGGEAEQEKHDHPPRRNAEPAIERPADERADQRRRRPVRWKAGSRGRLPTDRSSNRIRASTCRLVPGLLVEPFAETLEPRGESSLFGGPATVSASVACAFGHGQRPFVRHCGVASKPR